MVHNSSTPYGQLFIIATPIGNMNDISARAIQTLKSVSLIAAEDTRHSKYLLQQLTINTPMTSYHNHNEEAKATQLLSRLYKGDDIALICDAGTPLISDPGFSLVRMARAAGVKVTPIPGCCAFIAALSASGIASHPFLFAGFLPAKSTARITALQHYAQLKQTLIVYESTHRLGGCLTDIATVYGAGQNLQLAKELTKAHEAFVEGTSAEIKQWLDADILRYKGEFIIIIPAEQEQQQDISAEDLRVLQLLLKELPLKQAVKLAATISGKSKNTLYQLALDIE
jgi:16S rRNA (cytidine1402-2'-O)-methyltransferase